MKVSILTLHAVSNYGTQLQAYATQEKLKEYFDEVEFINYKRKDTYGKELVKTFSKGNPIRAIAILPTIFKWKRIFGGFQKKSLNLTEKTFYSNDELKKYKFSSDAYITGSDQVWNSGWNKGVLPEMYLDFIPNSELKFAYASSFGSSTITKEELRETQKLIKSYKMISVREESGLAILKNQYKFKDSFRIVDPTLAVNGDFWRHFAENHKKIVPKKKYILIYNLNRSKEFDDYAKKLAKKTGFELYRFCTRYDQMFRSGRSFLIPKIEEFVSLIDNAEFVLTDSFHATAFSMNLNTKPICIYPENYSGRLSDFLKLVESENVHAKNFDDFDVLNSTVDFDKVNFILDSERQKVDDYLLKVKESVSERKNKNEK